jgi:hypothetical protein
VARLSAALQTARTWPHDHGADAQTRREADRRFHAGQPRR